MKVANSHDINNYFDKKTGVKNDIKILLSAFRKNESQARDLKKLIKEKTAFERELEV